VTDLTLPPCPTPCDDDCELNPDGCHESHEVPSHRGHQPHGCHEIRVAIAGWVAVERERIARLAEKVDAFYDAPCPDGVQGCIHQDSPFAALIREQP
jgi:hypothetical protein